MIIGKQNNGISTAPVYAMAQSAVNSWRLPKTASILDLGGGAGSFSNILRHEFNDIHLADAFPSKCHNDITQHVIDLNREFDQCLPTFDAIVSLEVIEHLENPREFFRSTQRLLKPNGRLFISTPNQHSIVSKLCFLIRDQHQNFQDSCYPAHITALLKYDFYRIAEETDLHFCGIHFSNSGRIPFSKYRWQNFAPLKGIRFSDNIGFEFQKKT